jgi:hypothetical protein
VGNQFHAAEGAGSHRGAAGGEVLRRKMVVTAGGAYERRRKMLERYRRCRTSPGSRRKGRRWSETRNKDGQK